MIKNLCSTEQTTNTYYCQENYKTTKFLIPNLGQQSKGKEKTKLIFQYWLKVPNIISKKKKKQTQQLIKINQIVMLK